MGRNMAIVIEDEKGDERASHRVTYGSRIHVDEGDKVKQAQRLAEWDPYTRPVLTEVDGTVEFEDVVDGLSVAETADESTGITKRVVVDWRANPRGADLKPAMVIKETRTARSLKLDRGGEARYFLSVDAILSVEPGDKISAGDVLARIPLESAKTKDITGGLPRVAELFEARRPKDHAVIAEIDGTIRFGRDYKNKRRISIEPHDSTARAGRNTSFRSPSRSIFRMATRSKKGTTSSTAIRHPTTFWRSRALRRWLPTSSTRSRKSIGCRALSINDKHIEVIVRQMLQKVEITDAGDTRSHRR